MAIAHHWKANAGSGRSSAIKAGQDEKKLSRTDACCDAWVENVDARAPARPLAESPCLRAAAVHPYLAIGDMTCSFLQPTYR